MLNFFRMGKCIYSCHDNFHIAFALLSLGNGNEGETKNQPHYNDHLIIHLKEPNLEREHNR
jgi:hypothetical protein